MSETDISLLFCVALQDFEESHRNDDSATDLRVVSGCTRL